MRAGNGVLIFFFFFAFFFIVRPLCARMGNNHPGQLARTARRCRVLLLSPLPFGERAHLL